MVNIWSIFGHIAGSGCPLCRTPGDNICQACLATLPRNRQPCPSCALPLPAPTPTGTLCADCQNRKPAFDRALIPLLYLPPVDDLVGGFKYRHRLHLGRVLADALAPALLAQPTRPQLLLPVPAAPRRLAERGFNQAAELARWLSGQLDVPYSVSHLLRVADKEHQLGSRRSQRRRNVRGVFACHGELPAHVALIDDVVTTGATADAAGRVLKRAGAQTVELWAVARTPQRR
jgi:ComF family protein